MLMSVTGYCLSSCCGGIVRREVTDVGSGDKGRRRVDTTADLLENL